VVWGLDALAVPVVQAPMAGVSGGRLAAAVTRAGGLGTIGVAPASSTDWLREQHETASVAGDVGIGLMAWVLETRPELLETCVELAPALVSVSFGRFERFLDPLRAAGCAVTTQVGTLDEARRALDAGVDLLVVRGSEAGGHGRDAVATLPLLQDVLDVADVPVLAAGGVSGPRGVAAVLAAGAAGVWAGTAFLLCAEALTAPAVRDRLRAAGAETTVYSSVFDRGQRLDWPPEYGGRHLRSAFTDGWAARVDEIASDDEAFARIEVDRATGGDAAPVYVGQGVGALDGEPSAAEVVAHLGAGVDLLARAAERHRRR
jgi:nitronate monooxygenase